MSEITHYAGKALYSYLQTNRNTMFLPTSMLKSDLCSSQKQLNQQHFLSLLFPREVWKLVLVKSDPLHLWVRERGDSVTVVCKCFFINVSVRSCPAWLIPRVHIHLLPQRKLTADVHWSHFMLTYNPSLSLVSNISGWLCSGLRNNWYNYWKPDSFMPTSVLPSQ